MDDGYKLVVGVPSVEDYCSLVLSRCTGLYRDGFLNQAMGWQFRVVQAASTFAKTTLSNCVPQRARLKRFT